MKFDELHALIPYAKGGKEKVLTMSPYTRIQLAMPGRHALDTTPIGGDFVVRVTDDAMKWKHHEFTHSDLFLQAERYREAGIHETIGNGYHEIINGADPDALPPIFQDADANHLFAINFFHAVQCLAVAEHRRYVQHEVRFGGRYLPFRFAAGILEGLWDSVAATALQKKGRPGVEMLERKQGMPGLTESLLTCEGLIQKHEREARERSL